MRIAWFRIHGLVPAVVATALLNACAHAGWPGMPETPDGLGSQGTFAIQASPTKPVPNLAPNKVVSKNPPGCTSKLCMRSNLPGKTVTKFVPGGKKGKDIFPSLPIAAKKKTAGK